MGDFTESRQIQNPPYFIMMKSDDMHTYWDLPRRQIETYQLVLITDSPNLMLTKVSHYTVYK